MRVKAGQERFEETNLSVITSDGQFYSFNVQYRDKPGQLAIMISPATGNMNALSARHVPEVVFTDHATNETKLRKLAAQASITARNVKGIKDAAYDVAMQLTGLYISGDWFIYKFVVTNNSAVSYDIGRLGFSIHDRKQMKRTATQEVAIDPLLLIGATEALKGKSSKMLIAVLPKQVISSDKQLIALLEEHNGGRNLQCSIRSSTLLKAKPIVITSAVDNIPNVLTAGK